MMIKSLIVVIFRIRCKADLEGGSGGNLRNFQRLVEPGTSEPLGRPGSTEATMRGGLLSQLFSTIKGPVNLYPFCQTLAQSQPYFFIKIYPFFAQHCLFFSDPLLRVTLLQGNPEQMNP